MKSYELICVVSGHVDGPPNAQFQCVQASGFSAILSKTPRPLMTLPASRADALKDAAKRQSIYESLLSQGTVLAVKPRQWIGIEQVPDCLRCNSVHLAKLVERLNFQVQYQITVDWDAALVLGHFRTAPEMTELFNAATPSTRLLETSLSRLRARLGNQIHDLIAPVATELIALPRLETTLCNLAVLISNDKETALDRAVEAVDALWSAGLKIRQIGPSAAGSFALLELDWISDADIKKAHAILGTNSASSHEERRAARRKVLMSPMEDTAGTKQAGDILERATQIEDNGYFFVRVSSEDQGQSNAPQSQVA